MGMNGPSWGQRAGIWQPVDDGYWDALERDYIGRGQAKPRSERSPPPAPVAAPPYVPPDTAVLARTHHDHWLKTIEIPSGRLAMAVEEWDDSGNSIRRVLSISARAGLAQAAFDAAMLELPQSNLYLREAARVLRHSRDTRLKDLDPVYFLSFHGDYTIGPEDEVILSLTGLRRALEALRDGRTAAILHGNRIIFRVVKKIDIRDELPDPRDQCEE